MIILGIDPGYAIVGYGVIEKLANVVLEFSKVEGKSLVLSVGEFVLVEDEVDTETQKEILKKDMFKIENDIENIIRELGSYKKKSVYVINIAKKLLETEEFSSRAQIAAYNFVIN